MACRGVLPQPPTITVETSPGRHHFIYIVRDLQWPLWHGVQQTLIDDYGSDPRAGLRAQVLRLPGTLHLKDPARPHLVRIVEEQTSRRAYTAAEIAAAFPPRAASPRRVASAPRTSPAAEWQPDHILSAFRSIDAHLQACGPFTAQGDRADDQAIHVDWSRRDWWLLAMACLHHASGGSDEGFALSCAVSGGDRARGLAGCPGAFDAADQRRIWNGLTSGTVEARGLLTMRTIYWIAQRYCCWKCGPGRPYAQPMATSPISDMARDVMAGGALALAMELDRARSMHAAVFDERLRVGSLKQRIVAEIRSRLNPHTGIVAISSLRGFADTVGCSTETLRRYLRQLAEAKVIVKNDGKARSGLGTSGITIALWLPEALARGNRPPEDRRAIPRVLSRPGQIPPIVWRNRATLHPGRLIPRRGTETAPQSPPRQRNRRGPMHRQNRRCLAIGLRCALSTPSWLNIWNESRMPMAKVASRACSYVWRNSLRFDAHPQR